MSTTPRDQDRDLHDLLRSWEVQPRDDPGLARQVWARLAAEPARGPAAWFDRLSILFARPAMAAAAIVLFATVGALAAQWHNASAHDARVAQLAAEYARTIDPILMTHAGAHASHAP